MRKSFLFTIGTLLMVALTLTLTACGGSDDDENNGGKPENTFKLNPTQLHDIWIVKEAKLAEEGNYADWEKVMEMDPTLFGFTSDETFYTYGEFGNTSKTVYYTVIGNIVTAGNMTFDILSVKGQNMYCKLTKEGLGTLFLHCTREQEPNSPGATADMLKGLWEYQGSPLEEYADESYIEFKESTFRRIIHVKNNISSSHEYAAYKGKYIAIKNDYTFWHYTDFTGSTDDVGKPNCKFTVTRIGGQSPVTVDAFLSEHFLSASWLGMYHRSNKEISYIDLNK